jgi:hypothetical protein
VAGNQSAQIFWQSVAGASSYNIRYSTINGGPYQTIAASTLQTSNVVSGLINGTVYYFVVTAITGGIESPTSEQVQVMPFDTTKYVFASGTLDDDMDYAITNFVTNNISVSSPLYEGNYRYVAKRNYQQLSDYGMGSLAYPNIGSMDISSSQTNYIIYDFGGPGSNIVNLSAGWVITTNSGWQNQSGAGIIYSVNGVISSNYMLNAVSTGSISILPPDTNHYVLTVLCPDTYNNPRNFTLTLTSTNGDSATYPVNESLGHVRTFQWIFQGQATLTATNLASGYVAPISAIFLDDFEAKNVNSTPAPPTGVYIQSN